ncbi:MAG: hypothetical protein DIU61_006055 [Bacteroidota bacterium]
MKKGVIFLRGGRNVDRSRVSRSYQDIEKGGPVARRHFNSAVPLSKHENKIDFIGLKASSFILAPDGSIVETKRSNKNVLTEKYDEAEVKSSYR